MSSENIVQAWKDEDFREELSAEQIEALPENPAGSTELTDEQLEDVDGGSDTAVVCCTAAIVGASAAVVSASVAVYTVLREA